MKKKLILCLIALLAMGTTADAQGLLKKLQKGVEKIDNALGGNKNTNAGNNTQRNNNDDHQPRKERFAYNGPKSNFYDIKGQLRNNGMTGKAFTEQFGEFKKTAATKVINIDDMRFLKLGYFSCGRAFIATAKNGAYCIDTKGNIVKQWAASEQVRTLHPNFTKVFPIFGNNRFIDIELENGKNVAVIYDQDFKVIKNIPGVIRVSDYQDGVAFLIVERQEGLKIFHDRKYIDVNGNEVFTNLTAKANQQRVVKLNEREMVLRPQCDGLTAFCAVEKNGMNEQFFWGFRDDKGNVVIPAKYKQVQDFSNGLAAVVTAEPNAKWGFIDTKGNMVIQPTFTRQPSRFDQCGLALVQTKDNQFMFIDKTGKVVSETYDRCITPFCNGRAIWTQHEVDNETVSANDRTYLIDSQFNIITALWNDRLFSYPTSNGMEMFGYTGAGEPDNDMARYATQYPKNFFRDGRMYFVVPYSEFGAVLTEKGDVQTPGITGAFTEGIAPVVWRNEAGYVNMQGEWIIKFEENKF